MELEANTYSAQREAEIAGWLGEASASEDDVVDTEQVAVAETDDTSGVEETIETTVESGTDEGSATAVATTVDVGAAATVAGTASAGTEAVEGVTETATDISAATEADVSTVELDGNEPVQVAALAVPTVDMMPANPLEREVEALGIQEYSQRLAAFHTQLVRMVYGEIKYPKRAVRRSLEGRMELDVTLTADGTILNIALASSSGHQMLDEAAMEAAEKAFDNGLRTAVDPVAIAEFGSFETEQLTIPVPVAFLLQ